MSEADRRFESHGRHGSSDDRYEPKMSTREFWSSGSTSLGCLSPIFNFFEPLSSVNRSQLTSLINPSNSNQIKERLDIYPGL